MIDILLATYNGSKYLAEQLDSLFNQNFKDFKVLIHDDGSTDNTVEIIKNYKNKYPNQIIWFDDGIITKSACNNFAHLLSKSTSKYIMFCDQDDVWLNNKIQKTYDVLSKIEQENSNKPILVFSNLEVVDASLISNGITMFDLVQYKKKNSLFDLMVGNYVTGNTVMINKICKEHILPFSNNVIMHDWWIALIATHYGKVYGIDECLTLYRQHEHNVCGANIDKVTKLQKLKKISMIIKENILIIKMLRDLPFKVNYIKYFLYKIKMYL